MWGWRGWRCDAVPALHAGRCAVEPCKNPGALLIPPRIAGTDEPTPQCGALGTPALSLCRTVRLPCPLTRP